MQTTVIGNVENGKFVPNSKEYFKKAFESYEGKTIELSLKVWHKKRTNPQNSYYRGVVVKMITFAINHLGNEKYSEDIVHELLKDKFIQGECIKDPQTGKVVEHKTTTKLSTVEFENYVEQCKRYAAEQFDLYIPDADRT